MISFGVVFPVFAIALCGYLVAYTKILSLVEIDGLSRFVFRIALPVLLFYSLANIELPAQIEWGFLLSYYVVAISLFGLGMLVNRYLYSGSLQEQAIFGLGASFSNLLLVGLPIISGSIGEEGLLPLFLIVSIHSLILYSIATVLLESGDKNNGGKKMSVFTNTFKKVTRNPIIIGLLLGWAFNLSTLPMPGPLDRALEIFSRATLPCALFVLGASLTQYRIAGQLKQAVTIIGLKMVLQPLLVWVLAFWVFRIDLLWGTIAVLAAGMPVGVNTFLFAHRYQAGTATLSTAILLSTLFAVFSQTILLSILV